MFSSFAFCGVTVVRFQFSGVMLPSCPVLCCQVVGCCFRFFVCARVVLCVSESFLCMLPSFRLRHFSRFFFLFVYVAEVWESICSTLLGYASEFVESEFVLRMLQRFRACFQSCLGHVSALSWVCF